MQLMPSIYWNSDNEWEIPSLDIAKCPVVIPAPFNPWGSIARSKLMQGTWHFYVHDYKFNSLWEFPDKLLASKPSCAVEPNFSIPWEAPKALALYQIYRKRHCAKYWQSQNICTLVDLNVDYKHEEINLIGVPKGWWAYCTRGACWDESILKHQFELACKHSGRNSPLFAVYAGGKKIKSLCEKNNWHYFETYRGPMNYRGAAKGVIHG